MYQKKNKSHFNKFAKKASSNYKNKIWNRILFRMSIWVLLLGIASILIVSYFVKMQMRRNIEKQIADELQMIQDNSELYIRQIMLLQNNQINESGFQQSITEIQEQLKNVGYKNAAFYDTKGNLLTCSDEQFFTNATIRKDFQYAKEQKSAFTLHYGQTNQCDVYFTMPVKIMNRWLGMITYYLDYTEVYQREWNTIHGMIQITIVAIFMIYLAIWLILRRMVSPIRSLSRISGDISRHLKDGQFDSEMLGKQKYNKRRDEIGELSRNYMQMIYVTKEQFEKIQEDRDHILELWNSRQEFYNNVTHELKTPLTTISGYAQLMEEHAMEDEELFYQGLEHILQESTRLHRMVVQLLEMQDHRLQRKPSLVELESLIRNVIGAMQIKAKRYNNKLVFCYQKQNYLVKGFEDRIRQVLINLIDNAIKYGKRREEIRIKLAMHNDEIWIMVSNQGTGLANEELDHIFEPFYRIDKERSREMGSSGLGLTIVKKIMEEHKGSIHAKSEADGCITFTICFPAADQTDSKQWEAQK